MNYKSKLAIHGGTPVRDKYLPYGRQWIDQEDIKAVVNVLNSDYLTTGPIIEKFEHKISKYVGARYAVAFSNGTAALHGACYATGIKSGDEVITSPMTFVASSNCILYQGGKPVFADIDMNTYNIDTKSIKKLITDKTKAIIPVDYTGLPADLEEINNIAKKHRLVVIEDGAHALGASYKGKRVGAISDMTMFSFHPVKHITTGEGGIITTDNKEYFEKLKQFRTHGITKQKNKIDDYQGAWYYEMQMLGYNYRITDIQASLGISQFDKLDKFIKLRREYANIYSEAFKDIEEIICQSNKDDRVSSSHHLYVIRLNLSKLKATRKEIYDALIKENIGVNVHYMPAYYHPYYKKLGYKKGICPNAEKLYSEIITLPLFPAMSRRDICDVVKAVKKIIYYYSKSV
ncbi:UDP-4-amino-4,6-dideoxy-N-acetyl-beta-L-altrosamine transaminase [Clostridiaceae bacterium M8S5]|nr:UDP-4-amino-4,6-dideoxy-N-acetyl-beta-L-altrosamine transaminase [Clostridiaceae bacterium M8S5]